MAAIARPGVCENRKRPMSRKLSATVASVAAGKGRAPVRVKLPELWTLLWDRAVLVLPDPGTRAGEGAFNLCARANHPCPVCPRAFQ